MRTTTQRKDNMPESDIIGGFPVTSDYCAGCGKPLLVENAWMTDGCPCNSRLGVNSMNETRWRLLMELQQRHSRIIEQLVPECPKHPGCKMVWADGTQPYHDRKSPHWRCEVWVGSGVCGQVVVPDAGADAEGTG